MKNVYNMDKTEIMPSKLGSAKVLVGKDKHARLRHAYIINGRYGRA
jgi:hypothetical protein